MFSVKEDLWKKSLERNFMCPEIDMIEMNLIKQVTINVKNKLV